MRAQSVFIRRSRSSMTGCNRGLKRVTPVRSTELGRSIERSEPAPYQQLIPSRAILIHQQDRYTLGPTRARDRDACISISAMSPCASGSSGTRPTRILPSRNASSHNAGLIQSSPAVARGISLVEDEIDDLEHRRQSRREFIAARNFERNARFRERSFCADDSLRDSWLACEKCAGRSRQSSGRRAIST